MFMVGVSSRVNYGVTFTKNADIAFKSAVSAKMRHQRSGGGAAARGKKAEVS
jgi:hypothetical protein